MNARRLILAAMVALLAITPIAGANTPTCTEEHFSGEVCQGADAQAEADECRIKVWVGEATCEVTAADGVVNWVNFSGVARADEGVVPEADYVIRDKATGAILHQGHVTNTPSDGCGVGEVPPSCLAGSTSFNSGGGGVFTGASTVICEITGTHTQLGAFTAALGETPNVTIPGFGSEGAPQLFNNSMGCNVAF